MAAQVQDVPEYYYADAGKTYWHETEARRLMNIAQAALFDVHRYMEDKLKRDDWHEVYGLRVKLGTLETRLNYAWEAQHQKIMDHLAEQDSAGELNEDG